MVQLQGRTLQHAIFWGKYRAQKREGKKEKEIMPFTVALCSSFTAEGQHTHFAWTNITSLYWYWSGEISFENIVKHNHPFLICWLAICNSNPIKSDSVLLRPFSEMIIKLNHTQINIIQIFNCNGIFIISITSKPISMINYYQNLISNTNAVYPPINNKLINWMLLQTSST